MKREFDKHEDWDVHVYVGRAMARKHGVKATKQVAQDEYYDMLADSKFTLVIPSYDNSTFSILRFVEALMNNCLPFVLNSVCLDELKATFPDMHEVVKRKLIVSDIMDLESKIESMSDEEREETIDALFDDRHFQQVLDLSYVRKVWNEVLNES